MSICFFLAAFEVIRRQGSFGNINVTWTVSPNSTPDVYPAHGILQFKDAETIKAIIISSSPDEVNVMFCKLNNVIVSVRKYSTGGLPIFCHT